MSEPNNTSRGTIQLADVVIDFGRRRVTRDGQDIKLGGLTYALLVRLADAAPDLVTHDQLAESVWNGRPVTPETITQRVKLLRDALGDDPQHPVYIEGIRGQGYRLIPAVEPVVNGSRDRPRRTYGAAALIMVALVGLAVWAFRMDEPAFESSGHPQSIAVLPFTSQSADDSETEFLAIGIHDDIITQLARRTSLRVISRTSVMGYADTTHNIRQIGRELGAEAILEGNVQRMGDLLDINVQLIDARTDVHLWAQSFSDSISESNLISIQNDLAAAIVGALGTTIAARPTPSTRPEAYTHYLNALGYRKRQANLYQSNFAWIVDQLEKALAIDPNFALAHAELSRAYSEAYLRGVDHSPEMLEKALDAVNTALEIAPELPEAHFAMGQYLFQKADLVGARREIRRAVQAMPEDTNAILNLAAAEHYLGNWADATALLEQARVRDPLNASILNELRVHAMDRKDYATATAMNDRLLDLQPDNEWAWASRARIILHQSEDPAAAIAAAQAIPVELNPFLRIELEWLWNIHLRQYETALAALDSMEFEVMSIPVFYAPKSFFAAIALHLAGHPEAADKLAEAEAELRSALTENPGDPRIEVTLAQVLGALGNDAEALALVDRVLDTPLVEKDKKRGQFYRLNAIRALALTDAPDRTMEVLREYLSGTIGYPWGVLSQDPRLDSVRDHPGFADLARIQDRIRKSTVAARSGR